MSSRYVAINQHGLGFSFIKGEPDDSDDMDDKSNPVVQSLEIVEPFTPTEPCGSDDMNEISNHVATPFTLPEPDFYVHEQQRDKLPTDMTASDEDTRTMI